MLNRNLSFMNKWIVFITISLQIACTQPSSSSISATDEAKNQPATSLKFPWFDQSEQEENPTAQQIKEREDQIDSWRGKMRSNRDYLQVNEREIEFFKLKVENSELEIRNIEAKVRQLYSQYTTSANSAQRSSIRSEINNIFLKATSESNDLNQMISEALSLILKSRQFYAESGQLRDSINGYLDTYKMKQNGAYAPAVTHAYSAENSMKESEQAILSINNKIEELNFIRDHFNTTYQQILQINEKVTSTRK
jgi:hypothetical protein